MGRALSKGVERQATHGTEQRVTGYQRSGHPLPRVNRISLGPLLNFTTVFKHLYHNLHQNLGHWVTKFGKLLQNDLIGQVCVRSVLTVVMSTLKHAQRKPVSCSYFCAYFKISISRRRSLIRSTVSNTLL